MSRTQRATETRMMAKDLRLAERLRGRGWIVYGPPCEAHGTHPHGGRTCLDCPVCWRQSLSEEAPDV